MKKDLKGKERAVPPGIEIPGIPARKLVKLCKDMWGFTVVVRVHGYRIHGREAVYC